MGHQPNSPREGSSKPEIEVVNINEASPPPALPVTPVPPASLNGQSQNWTLRFLKQFGNLLLKQVSETGKIDTSPSLDPKAQTKAPTGRLSFSKLTLALIILVVGGVIGYALPHPSSSSNNVDLIRHATIEVAYIKSDPNPPLGFSFLARGLYFCDVSYPTPGNASVKEVLKDIDEGTKNNSADVYQQCSEFALANHLPPSGHLVTLIVSGYRDPATSSFRNILRIIPE